jgi:putative transposase
LTGAIRGTRLPADVKLALVGAITEAKDAGFPIVKACALLMLEARRFHRWVKGRDPRSLTIDDLSDEPPVPKTTPHQITAGERVAIIDAARDEANSDKAHRKLAHHLSRTEKAFVSESTVLRVLRSVALVGRFQGRAGKPKAAKPETAVEAPNEIWAWDISYCRVGYAFWYLIAIIDTFSRKIVAHTVRPSATSDDVKDVFDKALANEGLLAMNAKMPKSLSDRGPQMRSKTIRRFFYDLGITQMFSRPRTPADNATIESFFATIKGERLYHGAYLDPIELADDADAFVAYYG